MLLARLACRRRLSAGPGGAKRFYEAVSVSGEADGPRNGHRILLDGKRSVRTPGGSILDVPHRELGHAVALEWDTQRPRVIPAAMPLTSLLSTAVDAVSDQMGAGELSDKAAVALARTKSVSGCMYHLNADLLLLREDPGYEEGELSRLQADAWDGVVRRVLDRLGLHCGGREQSNPLHPLAASHGGLMAEPVPEPAAAVFRAYLGAVPTAEGLVALEAVAAAGRSLLAAVALREGVLAAGDFSTAVRVDERFQQGRWGFVEGAHDVEEATLAVTASAAQLVWAYEPDFARLAPPAPPSRVQFFSKSTEAKKNQN